MGWVYLDDGFCEHPKVDRCGGDAGWLYVCALSFCRRNDSRDGFVSESRIGMLSDRRKPHELAQSLVDVGLFDRVPGGYVVHDFVEWNAKAIERSDKARAAAKKRWQSERNAEADANAMRTHKPEHSNGSAQTMPSPSPKPLLKNSTGSSTRAREPEPLPRIPSEQQTAELLEQRRLAATEAVPPPDLNGLRQRLVKPVPVGEAG